MTRRTWQDGPAGNTPILAATLNELEGDVAAGGPVSAYQYTVYESTYWYSVIKVKTNGQPIPGLVKRVFSGNYAASGTSGTGFIPPRVNPDSIYREYGSPIIFNASGWLTTGNIGEIVGPQIHEGVVVHGFNASSSQTGTDTLGFRYDGTSKIYSNRFGDTTASIAADGVRYTFGFGPALVINGVTQLIESNSQWGTFNTQNSGRQLLGVTQTGDIIICSVYGVTGVSGIRGNAVSNLMKNLGSYNAIMLDGGGSTQTYLNGQYGNFSSDVNLQRPVPDYGVIDVPISTFDSGWVPGTIASGFTASADTSRALKVRRRGETCLIHGRVMSGSSSVGAAWSTVGSLPVEFLPKLSTAWSIAVGTPANPVGAMCSLIGQQESGTVANLQCRIETGTAAYTDLSGLAYPML